MVCLTHILALPQIKCDIPHHQKMAEEEAYLTFCILYTLEWIKYYLNFKLGEIEDIPGIPTNTICIMRWTKCRNIPLISFHFSLQWSLWVEYSNTILWIKWCWILFSASCASSSTSIRFFSFPFNIKAWIVFAVPNYPAVLCFQSLLSAFYQFKLIYIFHSNYVSAQADKDDEIARVLSIREWKENKMCTSKGN